MIAAGLLIGLFFRAWAAVWTRTNIVSWLRSDWSGLIVLAEFLGWGTLAIGVARWLWVHA